LIEGIKALSYRTKVCNQKAIFFLNPMTNEINVELANGEILSEHEISQGAIQRFRI